MRVLPIALALVAGAATACAGMELDLIPALKDRTLRISLEGPRLEYQYMKCASKFLWCTKYELVRETWDLTKADVRSQLVHMGFVVRVDKAQ